MNNERRGFLKALAIFPVCFLPFSSKRKATTTNVEYAVEVEVEDKDVAGCNYLLNLEDDRIFRYPKRYGIPKGCINIRRSGKRLHVMESLKKHCIKGFLSPNEARKSKKK